MKKQVVILWATSVVIAFALGYSTKSTTTQKAAQAIVQSNMTSNKPGQPKAAVDNTTVKNGPVIEQNIIIPPAEIRPPISDVLDELKSLQDRGGMSMDIADIAESYLLVKNLTEQELLDALTQLKLNNDLNNPRTQMPRLLILGKLAELDPIRSIAFVEDNMTSAQPKMASMVTILQSWAKNDPLAAYDWYLASEQNNSSQGKFGEGTAGLISVFKGLADRDLDDAIEKLANFANDRSNLNRVITGITSTLADKADFAKLVETTNKFDSKQARDATIREWVVKNPEEMTQWLDTFEEGQDKTELREKALAGWMITDPANAADWYINTADEQDKQAYVGRIAMHWSARNPRATLQWLGQQTGIDTSETSKWLLESAIHSQPDFVVDNLDLLSNDKDKQDLIFKIYSALENNNKEKAAEFLAQSPYKDELNERILSYKKELSHRNKG